MKVHMVCDCGYRQWNQWAGYSPMVRCPRCDEWMQQNGPPEDQSGAGLIAEERLRQVQQEGWTPQHDRTHEDGELRRAALCYLRSVVSADGLNFDDGVPRDWPWDAQSWKPSDSLCSLIKAGALIAAEIDRLTPESPEPPSPHECHNCLGVDPSSCAAAPSEPPSDPEPKP